MLKLAVRMAGAASLGAAATLAQAQAYGPPITLEQAKKAMAAAEAEAKKNNWNMTIVILDSGCNPVMMQRADGAQLAAPQVAHDKAYTACAYKRPTKALQDALAKGGARRAEVGRRLSRAPARTLPAARAADRRRRSR